MARPYDNLHAFQQAPLRDLAPLAAEVRERLAVRIAHWPEATALEALAAVPAALAAHHAMAAATPMIWDIGHRSLMERMASLSGMPYGPLFPRNDEPLPLPGRDGHHGGALSEAVGVAMARRMRGESRPVIAFLGVDSIHNGQTYEAMNQAGEHQLPVVAVFLDTRSAGDPNSRSVSSFISGHLARHGIMGLKKTVKRLLGSLPAFGTDLPEMAHRAEESFIGFWTPGLLYEGFGFTYVGPVDGSDDEAVGLAFQEAQDTERPVFIHISAPAEREAAPIRKARIQRALPAVPTSDASPFFAGWLNGGSQRVVVECAVNADRRLLALETAFPGRCHFAGTSLQYAFTWAAALACEGFHPLVVASSQDLLRGYDQIVHDIAIQHLGVGCLVLGEAEGDSDLAVWGEALRAVPELRMAAPGDDATLAGLLDAASDHRGLTLIHFTGTPSTWPASPPAIQPGVGRWLARGNDLTLVAQGPSLVAAQAAAMRLRSKKINAGVYDLTWIKPFDGAWLMESAPSPLLVVESVAHSSGPAALAIAERLAALAGPSRALRCLPLEGDTVARIVEAAEALVRSSAAPASLGRRAI